MYPHNQNLRSNSQSLRKNMTPEEKHLWYDFLKHLPITVKRQHVVGNFILDFFIPSAKIAIELDGSQHYEPETRKADKERTEELLKVGIKVIRYPNAEININFDGVIADILKRIKLVHSDSMKNI